MPGQARTVPLLPPTSPTRISDGHFQVPTVTLEGTGGHEVELVGVIHLASQSFWDQLNADVAAAAESGSVILLEGLQQPSYTERATLPPRTERRLQALEQFLELSPRLAATVGVPFQKDAFTAPPGALSSDVSALDLLDHQRVGPWRHPAWLRRWVEESLNTPVARTALGQRLSRADDLGLQSGRRALALWLTTGIARRSVLSMRNRVAVEGIVDQAPRRVVTPWGAAHLPGMVFMLETKGYRVTSVQWRTAFDRDLLTALRQRPDHVPASSG